ncbi:MAG: CPBP family intramembrane metalloprotease [Caldisericia bacterium]|nr:CPBP family intramembrane metalloprotease [Caldisericia bacterium]
MDSQEINMDTGIVSAATEKPKKPRAGDWIELISYPVLGLIFSLVIGVIILLMYFLITMLSSNSFSNMPSTDLLKGLSTDVIAQGLMLTLLGVTEIAMILPVFIFGFGFKKFSWELFGLKPLKIKWQWIVESVLVVIGVNGLEMLIEYLQKKLGFSLPEFSKSNLDILNPSSRSIWLYLVFILSIGIIGPICEEILFRGAIYGWFRRYYKPWVGTLISSLFFGLLHYETMLRMIFAISIGAYMAWMYEREKNLAAPITFHILNNSIVVTLMFLFPNL